MADNNQIDQMTPEQLKEAYRVHNLEVTSGFKVLNELEAEGKITLEKCDLLKQRFYKMHKAMTENQSKETLLQQRTKKIALELSSEVLKLEKAQQAQKEHEFKLKALEEKLDQSKKDTATVDEANQGYQSEISKLENTKVERENEYAQAEQKKKDELNPIIDETIKDIATIKLDLIKGQEEIQSQDLANEQLVLRIQQQEIKLQELTEEYERQKQNYYKEKDEPIRLGKGNDNIRKGVTHLQNELEKLQLEKEHLKSVLVKEEQTLSQLEEQVTNKTLELGEKAKQIRDLDTQYNEDVRTIEIMQRQTRELAEDNTNQANEITMAGKNLKQMSDLNKKTQKKINKQQKEFKNEEYINQGVVDLNKELDTKLVGTQKLIEELQKDSEKFKKQLEDLVEEQQLFVGKLVTKGLEDKTLQQEIIKLTAERTSSEDTIKKFQYEVTMWNEELKFLSTIKEKMARTASQASAQARMTKEELKVKELTILDLTKKAQETDFRLKSFIALYEEVKNARNLYVSQIQNSSQDLAEMHARIKILQNEVEILFNESAEKDRSLMEIKHNVQKAIQMRDRYRTDLNKQEYRFRQKQSVIGQKINESDKLNLIINSLQKEMNNLIYEYEQACESRNYMGIQLIDRNDELCILYEKSNIQENILKNGEQKIREKEEKIKMINLELKERQRQLAVVHKLVPDVPKLAEQVIDLKKKRDNELAKVNELSALLENPEQHPNRRDLEGEDPDQDALQAKIQVLEERLNNKKEALLEKELVYEEVSNLAEKLRTQALDGRKTTLEINEKINEYRARTNDLARKLYASVSEVSMLQSKALKLQQEKEEKEQVLETAIKNLESGLAPTDDAEMLWDRSQRNLARKQMESEERQQRKLLEQQLPLNSVKSSALPRPNSYMPPDIQIPRPYGVFAPFKPSEPGAQMRHIVKPKPMEIEL